MEHFKLLLRSIRALISFIVIMIFVTLRALLFWGLVVFIIGSAAFGIIMGGRWIAMGVMEFIK